MSSAVHPVYTGLPELLDMELATSADFHVAATNFVSILDDFTNEIALNYIYRKCRTASDPIARLTEFYIQLNEGTLNVAANAVNTRRNIVTQVAKTLLSDEETFILSDDSSIETREISGNVEYHVVNLKTGTDRWVASDDTADKIDEVVAKLSTGYGFDDMEEEFVLHWREKFKREHPKVIESVEAEDATVQSSDDYLKDLSDCVGTLLRVNESKDNLSISLVDTEFTVENVWPDTMSPVASDKVDDETFNLINEMSRKCHGYSRTILINAIDTAATPDYAHGEALVGDSRHRFRINDIETDIESKLAAYVGQAYRLMIYIQYKLKGNRKLVHEFQGLEHIVENSALKINILKDRLTSVPKNQSNQDLLS